MIPVNGFVLRLKVEEHKNDIYNLYEQIEEMTEYKKNPKNNRFPIENIDNLIDRMFNEIEDLVKKIDLYKKRKEK